MTNKLRNAGTRTSTRTAGNGDRDPVFFERMLNFSKFQAAQLKECIRSTPKEYTALVYRQINALQREQAFLNGKLKEYGRL